MATPFWFNDVTILFNKEHIFQLYPTTYMSYESKLNAISRLIIFMTLLGILIAQNIQLGIVGGLTLAILVAIYKFRKQRILQSLTSDKMEGFKNSNVAEKTTNPVTLESVLRSEFHPTTKKNPFGNVLLTDIHDSPDRKAAAPSFNPDVHEEIGKAVKKQTQMLHPDIMNTSKQIYGDLKDNYDLDKSLMRFYSTPNTRVENDQGAYANYLYGSMPSGKEDTPEGSLQRVKQSWQWINP
jgi:hypothetical protein